MWYISWLDYKDMAYNPDDYLKNVKIANFDIINHECRGYPLQGTYKGYKTIEKNYFKNFSKDDEKKKLFLQLFVLVVKIYGYDLINDCTF